MKAGREGDSSWRAFNDQAEEGWPLPENWAPAEDLSQGTGRSQWCLGGTQEREGTQSAVGMASELKLQGSPDSISPWSHWWPRVEWLWVSWN